MAVTYTKNTSGEIAKAFTAEAALTANQFVKLGTGGTQVDVCGAGEAAIGVVEASFDADSTEVKVFIGGMAQVRVGAGGVTKGARLKSAAAGKAITAAATDPSYARALATGSENDIIPVLIQNDTNTHA